MLQIMRDCSVTGIFVHVGIHRPYYAGSDSVHSASAFAPSRATQAAYFKEMQIPPELLEAIHSTEPQRMRVLTPAELARYRLK
ncbi:hypothetical protein [Pseudomonas anguilliseptica]|uniref:hypothetical protein n=1 Tax=Pseudomonas anguilliseptica TaxID=53406 RepID=UPI000B8206E7|nr:hypothetical protein [Pseudomonas anguilliseptica]